MARKTLSEFLDMLPTDFVRVFKDALDNELQAELTGLLIAGDAYELNYRRGRARVLYNLLESVGGVLDERGPSEL